ncbi:hypothetical protein SLS62_006114 [Diatrype stigma]|uniref:Uncharacterized protein n=1 Tax=Diatrype stigma TaxID=117547 RepID=A0AAN9YPB5_9PEZI
MDCAIAPNTTIGSPKSEVQYWQFQVSLDQHANCTETTYLRPDIAGSILPWPYTLAWLLIHIPLVLIRVARWEKVQMLSLFLAAVSIASFTQAYSSTQRRPEEILVWSPLTVILDVGAVMQLFFLVVESSKGENVNGFVPLWGAFAELMAAIFGRGRGRTRTEVRGPPESDALINQVKSEVQGTTTQVENVRASHDTQDQPSPNRTNDAAAPAAVSSVAPMPMPMPISINTEENSYKQLRGKAIIVTLSALLFSGLVAIQTMGLASAIQGLRSREELTSSWCSPMFQSFAIAVGDGNCAIHPVHPSASKGIGCITLSGRQQAGWLAGTAAGTAVSLALQLADLLVLALVESAAKWRGVKMRRPWATMFAGIVVLVVYVVYGVVNASRLPGDMTERVWVFRQEPSLGIATVCRGTITPPGVRGSIMGWTDGFLSSWGRAYFG